MSGEIIQKGLVPSRGHGPGHPVAVKVGCTCPVDLNKNGAGLGYRTADGWRLFWVADDCEIHAPARFLTPEVQAGLVPDYPEPTT